MELTNYQNEKEENFKILLKDFLTDFSRRFNPPWICLNEKCDNYKFDKLFQNIDVIKYKTEIENIKFILSVSNDKFNLEIVYPDNEDFIYQVPFIEGKDFQELLREIYNEITKIDFRKMDDFYSFLKKILISFLFSIFNQLYLCFFYIDDTFDIISEYSIDVTDPDTGDNLGTITYIKASIIATVVYDKMCVCQNVKCYDDAITSFSKVLSGLNKSRIPLNVDTTQISGGFEEADKQIHIGDKAIKTN